MAQFLPLNIAVLTVSDTRFLNDDTSGEVLKSGLTEAGHRLAQRAIEPDDIYKIRARVSAWIAEPGVDVVITTGVTGRDGTPEAVVPLLDKVVEGFGELFRQISFDEIGVSTLQSRCVGGVANGTLVFCLPGSSGACRTGWGGILQPQLDARTKLCNFAELIPRLKEK